MEFQNVIFEHYNSLQELTKTIEKRPTNDIFARRPELASQKKSKANDRFYGSATCYKNAVELLSNGYFEPMEKMKKAILKIDRKTPQIKNQFENSVVGFLPNVPRALMGLPDSMINKTKTPENEKVIHLLYGFSALGNISASELIKGGINFISLVNSLEKQGYRIKIDIVRATTTEQTCIGYTCNVKEYDKKLNLLKLCFPLVHPSMLRRISFKWCETLPGLKDTGFGVGYGGSLIARLGYEHKQEKEFLTKQGILKKYSYYCNVYQAKDARDVNDLARQMGIIKW
jgi:hypothetical protein